MKVISASCDIGDFYFGKNGVYFLVQISDIIVLFDGVYSKEWGEK